MSNNDEIGDKSDMTRLEDLSEFLHQDDPEVNAALDSKDEPPSLDELPGIDELEELETQEESELSSFDSPQEEEEDNDFSNSSFSFNSEERDEDDLESDNDFLSEDDEDQQEDNSFSMTDDEDDNFLTTDDDQDDEDNNFSMTDDDQDVEDNNFSMTDDDQDDEDNSFSMTDDDQDVDDEGDNFSMTEEDQEDNFFSSKENDQDIFTSNKGSAEEQEIEQSVFEAPKPTKKVSQPLRAEPTYIDNSEKFEDVKSFAKNITYGKIANGGNPPFSVILRNIKFEEDVEDIMIILNEHELISPESESAMRQSLEGGSLLISQISEFAAIYLTHKFRRFDLDVQMGLSDELHPSKSYESDSVGLVSKSRINQNKSETTRIDKSKVDLDAIIIATTPTLENYKIVEYLGILSDFVIVNEEELTEDQDLSEFHQRSAKGHVDQEPDHQDEEMTFKISQSAIYNDLSEKLKPIALRKNANAVVGINYQITPLSDGSNYKISCSGSAVWVIDNN